MLGCQDFYLVLQLPVSEIAGRIRPQFLNVNLGRGVVGASDHRSNIRCYQQLALRNRVLGDCAGCGSYYLVVWCVGAFTCNGVAADSRATLIQRGSRGNRLCLRPIRAWKVGLRPWTIQLWNPTGRLKRCECIMNWSPVKRESPRMNRTENERSR